MCVSSVAANEDNNLTSDSSNDELGINYESDFNELSLTDTNSELSESQTIIVDDVGGEYNEMNKHSIRDAIKSANAGDTIVIQGSSYVHTHVVIDKQLTIKSDVGTKLSSCSSQAYSNHQGVFYLTSKASGTIIEGFNFNNDDGVLWDNEGYQILIDGASNVIIRNCTFSNDGYGDAIRLVNAQNTLINNVSASGAINGVMIIDSSKTTVESSSIKNNKVAGISIAGTSKDATIIYCNVTDNVLGFNLTSSDHIRILSNYIAYNTHGVYVNCNVTKIEIKGNFFNQNKKYEVLNDYRVRNLIDPNNSKIGYPDLEVIDNNYIIGLSGGDSERPVYRIIYQKSSRGDYDYDSANDVYKYVGSGKGTYVQNKGQVFLRYVFEINKNVECPVIYFDYDDGVSWSLSGNYELKLSEITQVKKGVYSISIVDENGNIASDLSSVPITFYLNKAGSSASPQEGDVYKNVMMKNGTATVRFYMDEFKESGNVITAVSPTPGANIDDKVSKKLTIDDGDIPGSVTNSSITVSNLNTYPNSNQVFAATLLDANNNPIVGETLIFLFNSKNITAVTDSKGKAEIKVSIAKEGTYDMNVLFNSDEIDYYSSSAKASVAVKKQATKIASSNLNMIPKMAEYYSVTLKDESNKALAKQKVIFKVNGKKYTRTTDSKGVAKVKLKFGTNKKTYKISISFNGNDKYNAVSKTNKIVVKYSSKTAKLTAPTVTIPPKTSKTYSVSLKDANGKGIAKQKVTIKINGKTYTKTTNSKGQASVKVKFNSLKNYKVSATYKGSKIYKKASSSGKIKVAKTITKITAPTVSILPKVSKTYTITLKANNKAFSKQKVTIKVNGKTYAKTTNSKGQVSVNVKFTSEKTYYVIVNYKGTAIYKASKATGKIVVSKITTKLDSYDKTYAIDASKDYQVSLKDTSGNAIANQKVTFKINGHEYVTNTDDAGKATINLDNQNGNSFDIITSYAGNDKYNAVSATNKITISNKTNVIFVDEDIPNSEIQNILNDAADASNVEFLGDYYFDISLNVNKPLNIYSCDRTILNAKANSPTLTISANGVNITNFVVKGNSGDAIVVKNADNVLIFNNSISNRLDESKIESYVNGSVMLPGYGVSIFNSTNVKLTKNYIESFESGIFAKDSSVISIDNNTLMENNYGVKYGFGVANTEIINNEIVDCIGLIIMTVPEGPSGYGIYFNNSAVNVTVNKNHIHNNFIGISLDANYSTGIVITQNTITDQILEGIRFNAGYDLAENAVEPVVTDNAIYRNARGPSMMILGEMSANPFGIYGNGLYNPSDRLQIAPNWYGTNQIVTWDNDTGVVGYGTMCPRINTSEIKFNGITSNNGSYEVVFYKNGVQAANLPEFDLFATLNWGTDNAVEVNFNVVNGVGSFSFNSSDYAVNNNAISITVASLINSTTRVPKIIYSCDV